MWSIIPQLKWNKSLLESRYIRTKSCVCELLSLLQEAELISWALQKAHLLSSPIAASNRKSSNKKKSPKTKTKQTNKQPRKVEQTPCLQVQGFFNKEGHFKALVDLPFHSFRFSVFTRRHTCTYTQIPLWTGVSLHWN